MVLYYEILIKLSVVITYCKYHFFQLVHLLLYIYYSIYVHQHKEKLKPLRPNKRKNVYFPIINTDAIDSKQIQVANIYDVEGNALLTNEYVVVDGSYIFQRFAQSIYLLIGLISFN